MLDILFRPHDDPRGEWASLPWGDPDFSRRMLREHLSQAHDAASRRQTIIDRHVAWIHDKVLGGQPARVLDLGCGPGFYVDRLVKRGHTCRGIDIGPASINYAQREHAGDFTRGDIREVALGQNYDLVVLVFGELNAFPPADAARIIARAHGVLRPGGKLLLEVSPYAVVARIGAEPFTWYTTESGLFADEPYLCLQESRFVVDRAISDHYVFVRGADEPVHYCVKSPHA
jgi:SAM-dependent methyltransferase